MSKSIKCPVCEEYATFLKNSPNHYRSVDHSLCEPVLKIFKIIDTYYSEPEVSEITKLIEDLITPKSNKRNMSYQPLTKGELNQLDLVIDKIFKIIPSYYQEDEANDIKELFVNYIDDILKQRQ